MLMSRSNIQVLNKERKLTEEEITVLRWLHKHAYLHSIGKSKITHAVFSSDVGGLHSLAGNIADYLCSPGQVIDLDEMFKEES